MNEPREIEFNRPSKYTYIEVLGTGACGETVHVRDEDMDADFVAKKYRPIVSKDEEPAFFDELLRRFRDEARILFRLNHPNIVRVFNFFDYQEANTSYIIMEYISGSEILDFLAENPNKADRVFEGVVRGFAHLQHKEVLHRDIRPANILVSEAGIPKIIDFGFGKRVEAAAEPVKQKSITLNWWCETPPEFAEGTYDFQTEVYFVGKLFQLAIETCRLSDFKYRLLLGAMCEPDRKKRTKSFNDVQRAISEGKFAELSFLNAEISVYRKFATDLSGAVSSIQTDARFERDRLNVLARLEDLHLRSMLEHMLPSPNKLISVFVNGAFSYWTKAEIPVENITKFLELFRGLSAQKRSIVIENIIMRLEACERTQPDRDDEIPF